MLTLLILAPIVVVILIVSTIIRLVFLPLRLLRPRRRFMGASPYAGACSRGFSPRPRFGGMLSILFLFAAERLFGRRW